jgi:hypothetical protein
MAATAAYTKNLTLPVEREEEEEHGEVEEAAVFCRVDAAVCLSEPWSVVLGGGEDRGVPVELSVAPDGRAWVSAV